MPVRRDTYTGWGRVLTATGDIARPERAAALGAHPGPAMGNRRSYGDAAQNGGGTITDMTRLDRFLAFDADTGVLEAEAGVPLSGILATFAPRGWMPAVLPGTAHATLGGAIAADVHGKNHERSGSFGQHVLSLRLAGPDGAVREIGPGAEPDLFRATLGGMGLTGVIESARIALAPCPALHMRVREERMPGLPAFLAAFERARAPFSVGWIDATAQGDGLGRGILETADFGSAATPPAPAGKPRAVPFDAPGFALAPPVVRAFNRLYFARIPRTGRIRTRPLQSFFFPLDGLANWNRLYGKRGFHQFQCVLPHGRAAQTLETMLREIGRAGLASPLAVLKRMGAGRAGPMSFPMAGYTLAVDFADRPGARDLIARLETLTVAAGGRIYLAKDSLARATHLAAMYPELAAFRATVRAADPDGRFETDLARRLSLRGPA